MRRKRAQGGSGEETRRRLLEAGLEIFGRHGYEAATTRLLSASAGTNVAAIPYHFGSKDGLYAHVLETIGDSILEELSPFVESAQTAIKASSGIPDGTLRRPLEDLACGLVRLFIGTELGRQAAPLIMREQAFPSDAFEIIYEDRLRQLHEVFGELIEKATGTSEERAILLAHTLVGQITGFRMMQETALRRLNWSGYDTRGMDKICDLIRQNVAAMLEAEKGVKA
jgi:AcrR family transcriptional regulator